MISARLPPILTLLAIVALLAGCSSSSDSGELRSTDQAKIFVVALAHGGTTTGWHLAGGASTDARRVWAERSAIQDLGQSLRREGKAWACQFAEDSAQLDAFGGKFNANDRRAVVKNAVGLGAGRAEINAMLSDVYKLANTDLVEATTAICG
jgi:hypothetical protein